MNLRSADPNYLHQCRAARALEQEKSLAETSGWSHVDKDQVHIDWDLLYKELVTILDTVEPTSDEAQVFISRHHEIASRFYPPKKDSYIGLALFYDENADMRQFHNAYHPNMVSFLGDAMYAYAMARL